MSTPDAMEEQLFQALRAVHLQMNRVSFEDLKARFAAVGEQLAPRFAADGHPDLALEVRRRVAEDILGVAVDARRPAEEIEQLLDDVIALGFAKLHHRARIITMVCGHFSHEPGHEALIDRHIRPLVADLTTAERDDDQELHRFHLEMCREILDRRDMLIDPA